MPRFLKRFIRASDGSVAIIAGLAAIPMSLLIGAGIDYGMAADRQAQLEGFADAAALSAVTPAMMSETDAQAQAVAQNTFNGQAGALSQISYNPANVTVTVTTTPGNIRTAVVSYSENYDTFFSALLGKSSIALAGSSTATGGLPPNIDFYLLLDDSPSMAIAATSSGIATMVANTRAQCDSPPNGGASCGCAFGCHETNPAGERHCNATSCALSGTGNPNGEDNYALARALGVTLRIDLLNQAAQNLMATAQSTETADNAHYRAAINTFDYQVGTLQSLT
ncbi:MAG: TadE/TadG family type IV pilus assembly protein, partial [Rhizomicrobium sp.]